MNFRTTTVGDMLEGFIDNMSDEQIDEELKLYGKISKELKMGKADYASMGVLIDEDHLIEHNMLDEMEFMLGYKPYREANRASGFVFLYFETLEHAEIVSARFGALFKD